MLLQTLVPAALVLALLVALFQTAPFHLNPFKVGLNRFDFERCVVYSSGSAGKFDYKTIPMIMSRNEVLHGLRYNSEVQIILCERQSDLNKYLPLLDAPDRRNAVAFAAWPNTIYVTRKLEQEYGTSQKPLAHELSHILLIQNYGIVKTTLLWKRQEWIPEGFATYLSGFPDYFPEEQLLQRAKADGIDMANGRLFGTRQAADLQLPIRFMIYRGFVAYLFQGNPSTVVIMFLKKACDDPLHVEAVFQKVFHKSLEDSVKAFWHRVQENA